MKDVECPYCNVWQEVNHDDGFGCHEDRLEEQQCNDCEKYFVFTTSIIFHYSAEKADCLNGGKHKYKATATYPKEFTKMQCTECEETRQPTKKEMKHILRSKR